MRAVLVRLALLLGVVSFSVHAQSYCPAGLTAYNVQVSAPGVGCVGGNFSSLSAAVTYVLGVSCVGNFGATWTFGSFTNSGNGDDEFTINGSGPNGTYQQTGDIFYQCEAAPVPPSNCQSLAQHHAWVDYPATLGNAPGTYCDTDTGCNENLVLGLPGFTPTGTPDGYFEAEYQYDGAACSGSTDPPNTSTKSNDPNDCQNLANLDTKAAPLTVCANGSASTNPTIDGTANNYNAVPDNSCFTGSDGGVVCYTDFAHYNTVPPVPDQGPTGVDQPSTPTGCVTATTATATTTVCQFSQSTTQNSTNYGTAGCPSGYSKAQNGTCQSGASSTGGTSGGTTGGSSGGSSGGTSGGVSTGSSGGTSGGSTGDSLSGGADCSAAPACTGDPVQCYADTELWKTQCAFQTPSGSDTNTAIDAGLTNDSGQSLTQGSLLPTFGTKDLSSLFTGTSPSQACPQDIPITLGSVFGTVTVPISKWCNLLHVIGTLLLGAACFTALRIYMDGFK